MTIYKSLRLIDKVERLYVSRKEGRRGLTRIENSFDASIRLEDYIENARRADYSHQKQYWQHEDQQNDNK